MGAYSGSISGSGRVQNLGSAAKVGGQAEWLGSAGDVPGGQGIGRDVGPAKPVDRLFGVAHDEQASGNQRSGVRILHVSLGAGGEKEHDLVLERIGVLELIHQDRPGPLGFGPPNLGMITQQVSADEEKVGEREDSLPPNPPAKPAGKRPQPFHEVREHHVVNLVEPYQQPRRLLR